MAEDLSPADRSSLAAEQGPVSMAVGGVLVFESEIGYERLIERIGSRLHLVPRYRQRLQHAASGITNPVWVDDDHFDIRWHVRVTRLSAPGTDAQLGELVGTEMSRRLDRARPLWEVTLVEGLEGGRNAVLAKMHHALVDGIAAIDIGTVILDPTPEPLDLRGGPDEIQWAPRPYDRRRHLAKMMAMPALRAQRALLDAAQRAHDHRPAPRRGGPAARDRADDPAREHAARSADDVAEPRDRPEPQLCHADGVPAGAEGRRQAARRDGQRRDPRGRRGNAPRSWRRASTRRARAGVGAPRRRGGRQPLLDGLVDLPTTSRPVARMTAVNAADGELKDSAAVRAGALILGAAGWAPPLVSSTARPGDERHARVQPRRLQRARAPAAVLALRAAAARALPRRSAESGHQGLTVGVLSYDGGVHFGLLADRDLEPPLAAMHAAVEEAIAALLGRFAPPTLG